VWFPTLTPHTLFLFVVYFGQTFFAIQRRLDSHFV
jgi:hypothetical protein